MKKVEYWYLGFSLSESFKFVKFHMHWFLSNLEKVQGKAGISGLVRA